MITTEEKKIKLLCFPFAGGSSVFYQPWRKLLPDFIDLQPYELPGRGVRIADPLCTTVEEAVDDIMNRAGHVFREEGYALFGHSMGGLIVLELTRRITQLNLPAPLLVFASGKGAPDFGIRRSNVEEMSDKHLQEYLVSLGGVSTDFFSNPELVKLFIPVIKNDLKLVEQYRPVKHRPFTAPVITMFGKNEAWTQEERKGWETYTSSSVQQFTFPGGHFFIKNYFPEVTRIIAQMLHHQLMC